MSMNIEVKNIPSYLRGLVLKARRYLPITFIVVAALVYGWLIFRINVLNRREPSEDAVAEKLQTAKRPKIDQSIIDKINELEDNSTEVQTLFKDARTNPFQE